MPALNSRILATASFAAIAFASLSGTATAQTQGQSPVSPEEAENCAALTDPAAQAACIAGTAQEDEGTQEAGELATLPPEEAAEQAAQGETIVVTGSRLRRSPFNSPDPLTIIDPELAEKGGEVDTAQILQSSPIAAGSFQITSVLSAGSFVTNGGVGAQTLSLRGLGAERTLVLVNGRRAGPAGTRGAIAGFDLNVIPSSLIDSVEILKTGASSIYGSDAIAGVVNLLTKKSTDGIEFRGFVSAPFEGGAETYSLGAAWGKEFNRGHFIVGGDYFRRNDLRKGQRDYLECTEEFLPSPTGERLDIEDPRTGEPMCNEFIQNMILVTPVGIGHDNLFSTIIQFNNPGDRLDEFLDPIGTGRDFEAPPGFFFTGVPLGTIDPLTGLPVRGAGAVSAGLVDEFDPRMLNTDIFPDLERYTIWADGSYQVTDNIELLGEFIWNQRKTRTDGDRQLFFFQYPGDSSFAGGALALPLFFCVPEFERCNPTDIGDPLNEGFNAAALIRPVVYVPTFNSTKVDYTRGVVGARGNFGGFLDGWNWDSYVQYSRSDGDYTSHRIFQDAVETQEFRTELCEGTVTRVRQVPCVDIDFTDPRVLAGNFTAEESAFLFGADTGNTIYDQLTAEASVSGALFHLPAGPVQMALGVQWRRDEIDDDPGDIAQAPNPHFDPSIPEGDPLCDGFLQPCNEFVNNAWGQSVAGRTAGHSTTKEAFGEVEVPLIHNTPLVQSLSLSGAARVTNVYAERHDGVSDKSNGNWTYKLGFNWQSTDWLRFRGTYGTSYRAPALFEQFLADQTGFLSQLAIDPCVNWGQGLAPGDPLSLVQQRCQALGIPPDHGGGSSALIISGGGIGVLEPETSIAKTVSVIFTPERGFWDGMNFSVAVDYFDIEVEGEIAQLGAGNIISGCLTSVDFPDDPFCSLFTRAPAGHPEEFNILEVRDAFVNINQQRNRGVDLTTRVTQDMGRFGDLSVLGQMTWQIEDTFKLFAGSTADFEGEAGEPTWVGDFKATWNKGPWSLFWNTFIVGGTSNEQDLRNSQGDVCFNSVTRGGTICPIYRIDPQWYHSASITREVGDRFSLTAGINNLFDNKPPTVSGAFDPIANIGQAPIFATQYDLIGRRAFVSVRGNF